MKTFLLLIPNSIKMKIKQIIKNRPPTTDTNLATNKDVPNILKNEPKIIGYKITSSPPPEPVTVLIMPCPLAKLYATFEYQGSSTQILVTLVKKGSCKLMYNKMGKSINRFFFKIAVIIS